MIRITLISLGLALAIPVAAQRNTHAVDICDLFKDLPRFADKVVAVRGLVEEKPWIDSGKHNGRYFVDELIGPDCRDLQGKRFTARMALFTWMMTIG